MQLKNQIETINKDNASYGKLDATVNVCIRHLNRKTKEILHEFYGSNRVTRRAIFGIIKFINNEFNETMPNLQEKMNSYLPRYLAFGSNKIADSSGSRVNSQITQSVTVQDTGLLSEHMDQNKQNIRIQLSSQGEIENKVNLPYVRLTLSSFIDESLLINKLIGECGLFTESSGDNCWARIVLGSNAFTKDEGTVIDVTWDITVVSVDSENQPYENLDSNKEVLRNKIYEALEIFEPLKSDNYDEDDWNILHEEWLKLMYEVNFSQAVLAYSQSSDELIDEAMTRLTREINNYNELYNSLVNN